MTCVEASVAGVVGNDKAEVRTLYLLVQELVGLPRTKAEILSPYVRVTLGKVQVTYTSTPFLCYQQVLSWGGSAFS